MTDLELMQAAVKARAFAYAPYSDFRVGAALLTRDGRVYTGCNIENASYTPTNCAERTAFFKAVSEGERNFAAIAIVGGKGDDLSSVCTPCGVCRQVMAEFCNGDLRILLGTPERYKCYSLQDLLPLSFSLTDER
ncbi:MAG: cytidine deaminase [Clostridia bacterium]|nr:cytidine deaminase [Clostridia bacterium]